MKQDIARYVLECDICHRVKGEHQKPSGVLQPLEIPEWKWDKVQMDLVPGFPRSQKGNDAIFVIIDRFSKVAHFIPVKEKITATQLAELYISQILSLHGIPLEISSDHGSLFTSRYWRSFQEALGTILHLSTAYHPSHKAKLNESIKCWKTCFELVLFPSVRNGRNLSRWSSSRIIIATTLV